MSTTLYTPRRAADDSLRYLEDGTLRILEGDYSEIGVDADDLYVLQGVSIYDGLDFTEVGDYGGIDIADAVLRFTNLGITQGATITNAILEVVSTQTLGSTGSFPVYAYDEDNASMPTDAADHAGRSLTTATVTWSPGSTTDGATETIDVTTVVQEVVSRAGFTSSSAIALIAKGDGAGAGQTLFFAANEHTTYAASRLSLTWVAAAAPSSNSNLLLLGCG